MGSVQAARPLASADVPLVRVDVDGNQAWLGDERLELTRTELAILRVLVDRAGTFVTRAEILSTVWHPGWSQDTYLVKVHVSKLRAKLNDSPRRGAYITTKRGAGYRFDPRTVGTPPRTGTLSNEQAQIAVLEEGLCAAWELITGTVPDQPGVRSWYMENLSEAVEDILTRRPNLRSASPAGHPGEASRA